MSNLNDPLKRSVCTLFSGLFLVANAQLISLQNINPVNSPVDTVDITVDAGPREHISAISAGLSSVSENYQSSTRAYSAPVATLAQATTTTQAAPAPQGNYLTFGGRSVPIFYSSNTMIDSGNQVALFNGKLLYGHNSAGVFGILPSLGVGSPISVTLNGQTTTYSIAYQITLEKATAQNYMVAISDARMSGVQYAYALMTCAGTSYGNGDASHRTIVFIK